MSLASYPGSRWAAHREPGYEANMSRVEVLATGIKSASKQSKGPIKGSRITKNQFIKNTLQFDL